MKIKLLIFCSISADLIISQKVFYQSTEEPKNNVFLTAIYDLNDWIINGGG